MATNRVDVTVPDLDSLTKIHVAELDDGCLAWVSSRRAYYILEKSSNLTPSGTDILAPISGSPIAGSPGALWVLEGILSFGPKIFYSEITTDIVVLSGQSQVPFISVTFDILSTGNALVEYTASVLQDNNAAPVEMGTSHQMFIDGVLVSLASSYETQTSTEEQRSVTIKKRVTGLSLGSHVAEIRLTTSDTIAGGLYGSAPTLFSSSLIAQEIL